LEKSHPDFVAEWKKNPLDCRFPGGESYRDVIKRLESLLVDVEMNTRPVLIISHITVLQLLVAYFRGVPVQEAWQLSVPRGSVMEVLPTSGGSFLCEEHLLSGAESNMPDDSANSLVQDDPLQGFPNTLACASKRLRVS
jgi:broad specificity phosphatase PhoE